MGDIEKAFLNTKVDKEDRFPKALWLGDMSDRSSKIAVYCFCNVVFHLNASHFLLNAMLRQHICYAAKCNN